MLDSVFESLQALPWLQGIAFSATNKYLLSFSVILMLWGLIRILRRSKASTKGIKASLIGLGLGIYILSDLIIAHHVEQYADLIPERQVASLAFEKHPEKEGYFLVKMAPTSKADLPVSEQQEWVVEGNEWQLTARVLRSTGIFSAPQRVRFYRLVTRETDEATNKKPRHAYLLLARPQPDLWRFVMRRLSWFPWLQAPFFETQFQAIEVGKEYSVAFSRDSILLEEQISED